MVESASIDEAYLDLTGSTRMLGPPAAIGEHVRAMVSDEQQITCSVGIGPTKFVAKVASRAAKPDGLVEVSRDGVEAFLHPMPVEAMWGVGASTAAKLHALGVFTVGDLAHTPRGASAAPSGRSRGDLNEQPGAGIRGERPDGPRTQRRVSETFAADSDDPGVVKRELLRMADRTARRMRKQRVSAGPSPFRFGSPTSESSPDRPPCRRRPTSAPRSMRPPWGSTTGFASTAPGSGGSESGWNNWSTFTAPIGSHCSPTRNGAGAKRNRQWMPPSASSGRPLSSGPPWLVDDEFSYARQFSDWVSL